MIKGKREERKGRKTEKRKREGNEDSGKWEMYDEMEE